jgi:manganese transport protein
MGNWYMMKSRLENSDNPIVLWLTVVPLALSFLVLLLYIVFKPFITKSRDTFHNHSPHNSTASFSQSETYNKKNIAVSVDFSNADEVALNSAFELGGTAANIHNSRCRNGRRHAVWRNIDDHETLVDERLLKDYQVMLTEKFVAIQLGFGRPDKVIPTLLTKVILTF